jgi:hypothetical protein
MLIGCGVGLAPPCAATNVSEVGFSPIADEDGVTVSVTGICCVVTVGDWMVTVIKPVYVLLGSPVMSTPTAMLLVWFVVLPDGGVRLSHEALSVADHVNVPPDRFVSVSV